LEYDVISEDCDWRLGAKERWRRKARLSCPSYFTLQPLTNFHAFQQKSSSRGGPSKVRRRHGPRLECRLFAGGQWV